MSAEDNLSEAQWNQPELTFPVHRGLNKVGIGQVRTGLGTHWSADKDMATLFAAKPDVLNDNPRLKSYKPSTVIHAEIPMSSVETHAPTLKKRGVDMVEYAGEKEVPAKKGSPITVTGMTRITWPSAPFRNRERKRTYNPPREMKA